LALAQKKTVIKYFNIVMKQYPYQTTDGKNYDKLLINWYASFRTMTVHMKDSTDPMFLTNREVDLLIEGFGFPYSNKIVSRRSKVAFLYNLINFYQRKGTSEVLGDALGYFGLDNVIISEWWLKHNRPTAQLEFLSQPVYPRDKRTESTLLKTINFDNFDTDYHWNQTESDVTNLHNTLNITLPSITPFIDISCDFDVLKLRTGMSIVQTMVQESYTYWIEYVLNYRGVVQGFLDDPNTEIETGSTYIVGTSPIGLFYANDNSYIQYTTIWEFVEPKVNDLVYINNTSSHHVFNGSSWVNLYVELPSTLINNDKFGYLEKIIPMSDFEGVYSLLELVLSVGYLFDSLNDTTDTRFVKYNGLFVPFDRELNGVRDNKVDDPNVYAKIYEEWDSKNFNTSDPQTLNDNWEYIVNNFQEEIQKTNSGNMALVYYDPDTFLSAINGDLKVTMDQLILTNQRENVLNTVLIDLERYLRDTAKVIDTPLAFMLSGFSVYNSYQNMVEFFKPYRARIHKFSANVALIDRAGDTIIVGRDPSTLNTIVNDVNMQILFTFGDQAPGDRELFDSSTVIDSLTIEQNYIV